MRWSILIIAISVVLCGGCGSATQSTAGLGAGSAVRWADEAARWADDPARRQADEAAEWVDDAARREAEEAVEAARLADEPAWQGADEAARATDIEFTLRTEVLKSKIENSIDYVEKGGCAIVDYAGMVGVPPTDDQVHFMVESYVPEIFLVESEGSYSLGTDEQVETQLVEINHLVWNDLYDSYSTDEPGDYFDILFEVSEAACKTKEALGG
jgi:hypothetical protein